MEKEKMPPLPSKFLDILGEYGLARTDGVNELEIQHRWLLVIDGIKDYARTVLLAQAQPEQNNVWRELFWQIALELNCLPSTSPDGNDHVLRKARALAAHQAQPQDQWNETSALKEIAGCFEAAYIEGLQEALDETKDGRLKDLVERRLLFAQQAANRALTRPAQPQEPSEPASDNRDWPEDFKHENGNYECCCVKCGNTFIGHKRRIVCKACVMLMRKPESGAVDIDSLALNASRQIMEEVRGPKSPGGETQLQERIQCIVASFLEVPVFSRAQQEPSKPEDRITSLSEAEFLSKRLARVAKLVGVPMPDMTHEQIAAVAGTVLGQIAGKLEADHQTAHPVSGTVDELPMLPHTTYNGYGDGSEPLYTTEQMHDYARSAVELSRAQQAQAEQPINDLLLSTLQSIVDADWRKWEELASPDEFVRWAKSRANHAINKVSAAATSRAQQAPVREQKEHVMLGIDFGKGPWHVEHRTNACSEICDSNNKVIVTCSWHVDAGRRADFICYLLNKEPK